MDRYLSGLLGPFVSLIEVHKLMYFLQEAGEPLRLRYVKAHYGPYAENLKHVFNAIEGHLASGSALTAHPCVPLKAGTVGEPAAAYGGDARSAPHRGPHQRERRDPGASARTPRLGTGQGGDRTRVSVAP